MIATSDEDWKEVNKMVVEVSSTEVPASPVAEIASTELPPSTPASQLLTPQPSTEAANHQVETMGPAVRGLLMSYGLSPKEIAHSGPNNQLLKGQVIALDVLSYIASKELQPKPVSVPLPTSTSQPAEPLISSTKAIPLGITSTFVDIPLSNMRKVIAKRLSESKSSIPHAYIKTICSLDKLISFRKKLKAENIKVSINDCIVKACAYGLRVSLRIGICQSILACLFVA
ncbi:unnamed protein product [Protopolystoma xenopodis]|uniref:2-oxoacid dehydrogenase acyltransferase catalytic domain-containing protein n=1 Tax=Protopolystoma xenopodis TaxID=117903 RepID=A0A3S4ZXK4_9PLAT|nr:unnamed protein product [Protopolystoma xenopodis]